MAMMINLALRDTYGRIVMNIQEANFRGAVADKTDEELLDRSSFRQRTASVAAAAATDAEKDVNGEPAHTGCVAFGMDRLAVAMFHTDGTDLTKWPPTVLGLLGF
jgi:hypothetical protein